MKSTIKIFAVLVLVFAFSCEKSELIESNDTTLERAPEIKEAKNCETAFAFYKQGSFCDDADLNSNRWGWTIGPLKSPHKGYYDIYASAGRCDTDNGYFVGTLYIEYNDGVVLADFSATEGYGFFETHLYVGNEKFPRKRNGQFTVAPGQYTDSHDLPNGACEDNYKIDGLSGDIYVIAHSVVCDLDKCRKEDDKS